MSSELETFTATESRPAATTVDAVMRQLRRPDKRAQWQSEIIRMDGPDNLGIGDSVQGLANMMGFRVEGRATTTGLSAGHYEEDVVVGVRMHMRFEVTPSDSGVVVTHRLDAPLPAGFAGRILSLFLRRRLRRMQRESLANLCRQAESDVPS